MGRPRAEIDKEEFEKLCAMQCTRDEICAWFNVTDKTLTGWCKRTYGRGFSAVFAQKRSIGKISLRRYQFNLAKKNAAMGIWLGRQYLGQRDVVEQTIAVDTVKDDELSASLKALADGLKSDEVQ